MNRSIMALLLSLVCCGLGQIYKKEILKGLDFIVVSASLIIFLFFSSHNLPWLYYSGICALALLWFSGMMDAAVDNGLLMQGSSWLTWRVLLSIMIGVALSGAVATITLLVLLPQADQARAYVNLNPNIAQAKISKHEILKTSDQAIKKQPPVSSAPIASSEKIITPEQDQSRAAKPEKPYFSIGLGIFANKNNAEKLSDSFEKEKVSC